MSGVPVGQRAVALPWLCPSADALLALTSDPPDGATLAGDTGAVAHILRFARPSPHADGPLLDSSVLTQPGLCFNAAVLLESADLGHDAELSNEVMQPVERIISTACEVANQLARQTEFVPPDVATCVTRLAALGWWAVAAVDPHEVGELLRTGQSTPARERQLLGLDVTAIGRRIISHWRLPAWVSTTLSSLQLTTADAARIGAPANLFRIVQTALAVTERRLGSLGLASSLSPVNEVTETANRILDQLPPLTERGTRTPSDGSRDLHVRLLRATAKARQSSGAVWLAGADDRIDRLANALAVLRAEFNERVQDAKLASMAEFAAGASHEINNPLAVISGHAQLLLGSETEPDRQKQLATIVRQTKRIHDLLHGALQFARPPRPRAEPLNVPELVADVIDRLAPDAANKDVSLQIAKPSGPGIPGYADRNQIRQALVHLVRNAIDAVPVGGWVNVSVEPRDQAVAICVDDNGPGPDPLYSEHLFDPFFSGRSAGRGRGLGLSIAWRLAQINGATVRYRPEGGPATRFELVLREAVESPLRIPLGRRSA